jgi:hypothetical protein
MAVTITIEDRDPTAILDIVKQLRASGLVQGVHFDFAYNQSRWDSMVGDVKGFTNFTFYEEKYSTLFALKYLS